MKQFRYSLEPYKGSRSRYTCPGCGNHKAFTRYVDAATGNHLGSQVGKCNRELKCSYHYKPKQYLHDNGLINDGVVARQPRKSSPLRVQPQKVSCVPVEAFKASLQNHSGNHFVQYLQSLFGLEIAGNLVSRYFIGSSSYWNGATTFWQIDSSGRIRGGKIMLYSPETGKRVKEPCSHITWVHKVLGLPDFHLQQCLFGEHLLEAEPAKPCAIVESEKTAIIASVYLPQFIWLAVGSLSNLNAERCQVLKGRKVVLFPDLNGYAKWQAKAKELSHLAAFKVSDLLEQKASMAEREKGLDLADYLVKLPHHSFSLPSASSLITMPLQRDTDPAGPIQIATSDIAAMLGYTKTGKEFSWLIIAGMETKEGKIYDLLFDAAGEPVAPGTQTETVKRLAAFFHKQFQPAFLDGAPCLLHKHN